MISVKTALEIHLYTEIYIFLIKKMQIVVTPKTANSL